MNVETYEINGYTVKLTADPEPLNPRKEYENVCVMCCEHRRYDLGDGGMDLLIDRLQEDPRWGLRELEGLPMPDTDNYADMIALAEKWGYTCLPLYLYDHSGITIRTTPFSCPWDSGQVGWAFLSPRAKASAGLTEDQAVELIKAEVKVYDKYLAGDVWGVLVLDKDGNEVESCYGILGEEDAREVAKDMIPADPQIQLDFKE
jgi:hypothetical protein